MEDDETSYNGGGRKASERNKQMEYLLLLQERNRLKKMMTLKTGVELENEEKEKGYSTHFRGANAQKKTSNNRKVRRTAALPHRNSVLNPNEVDSAHDPSTAAPARRGWAVERPKFLFGVRLGDDQPQSEYRPAINDGHMSLEDDEDDDEDYGEYVNDFEEFDEDELNRIEDNKAIEIADGVNDYPDNDITTNNTDDIPGSSDGLTFVDRIGQDQNKKAAKTDTLLNNVLELKSPNKLKANFPMVYSPHKSPKKIGSGISSFGSPLKLKLSQTNLFPASSSSKNIRNQRIDGLPLTNYDDTSITSNQKDKETLVRKFSVSEIAPGEPKQTESSSSTPLESYISIRIRVHNTWNKSKFVSLEAIRLGYQDSSSAIGDEYNDNKNTKPNECWIDLRLFTVKIVHGLQQLPASSEAMRSIETLISQGSVGSRNNPVSWKGPTGGSALDIYFEGNLPEKYTNMFTERSLMISSLQLNIWNAIHKESVDVSSPAKDVDMYVGTSCVWSGTLEQEHNLLNDRKNIQLVQIGKYLDSNNLAVFAPNRPACNIISMGKLPITNTIKIDQKSLSEQIVNNHHDKILINSKISNESTDLHTSADNYTGANSSGGLSWLSELKPNTKNNEKDLDFDDTPRRARPLSGRRAVPIGTYVTIINIL
jgi:hypothetical protein